MNELAPALGANLVCLGTYSALASGIWALAHYRMRRIEAEDGPDDMLPEHRWFTYAVGSFAWFMPAMMALYFLFQRDRARIARNCLGLLLLHFGLITLAAGTAAFSQALRIAPALPVTISTAVILVMCALATVVFGWRGSTARLARIEAEPPTGPSMGPERYAFYIGAAITWLIGPVAAHVLREPQNVRVGVWALRISLIQLALLFSTLAMALPLFGAAMGP